MPGDGKSLSKDVIVDISSKPDTPAAPPETVTLRLEDSDRTLIGTGYEGGPTL